MGALVQCGEKVAAFAIGLGLLCVGDPAGIKDVAVAGAAISGFVLGRAERFGPECKIVRAKIEEDLRRKYNAKAGSTEAADIDAAAFALQTCLEDCFIDRATLAKTAVTAEGFPKAAIAAIMGGLAAQHPEYFGEKQKHTTTYRFAQDVVEAGITSAIGNRKYYENLEPHLTLEMASALGRVESKVDKLDRKFDAFAKQLKSSGDGKALKSKLTKLEKKLNAKTGDLLALVASIIGKGVSEDQLEGALQEANESLQKSRAELEGLRSLANEVPEIESELAKARKALASSVHLDIEAAQAALKAARLRYQKEITNRRRNEALNVARMMETEATLARTRFDFLEAAKLYGEAAEQLPPEEKVRVAELHHDQGIALKEHGQHFVGFESLKQSVTAYESALITCTEQSMPVAWASLQNNLGNVYLALGVRGGGVEAAASLQKSVKALEQAVRVYSELAMTVDWAMAQSNLGNVYQVVGGRCRGDVAVATLQKSVEAYEQALRVFTEADMPVDWAGTQNNLGQVFHALGERTGGAHAVATWQKSVDAYHMALRVFTTAATPVDWAMTQNNLGNVYQVIGERGAGVDAAATLQESVNAYEQALRVYTKADMPVDWANTKNNLGSVYQVIGERSTGADAIFSRHKSINAFEQALQVRTEADTPAQWAMTQNNLGLVYQILGTRSVIANAAANYQKSFSAYENALRVITEAEMPVNWAGTMNNLGILHKILGERGSGADAAASFQKSITAFGQALRVRTEADMPNAWATTMANMAFCFEAMANQQEGLSKRQTLEKAVATLKHALRVFDQPGMEFYATDSKIQLARMERKLAEMQ